MTERTMTDQALNRPVWFALNGPQAGLAQGTAHAMRIDPDYGPFAAAAPGHEADLAALFTNDDDELWLVEAEAVAPPPGTMVRKTARLAQLVATGPVVRPAGSFCVRLGGQDHPEMAALAHATQPGPWRPFTAYYGTFYGQIRDGRLIAMAGERLRPAPGMIEVSAVCTDPAWRGQGLAAQLICQVMSDHRDHGAASFLHSYADNAGAIALYRKLGFEVRCERVVTILGKAN